MANNVNSDPLLDLKTQHEELKKAFETKTRLCQLLKEFITKKDFKTKQEIIPLDLDIKKSKEVQDNDKLRSKILELTSLNAIISKEKKEFLIKERHYKLLIQDLEASKAHLSFALKQLNDVHFDNTKKISQLEEELSLKKKKRKKKVKTEIPVEDIKDDISIADYGENLGIDDQSEEIKDEDISPCPQVILDENLDVISPLSVDGNVCFIDDSVCFDVDVLSDTDDLTEVIMNDSPPVKPSSLVKPILTTNCDTSDISSPINNEASTKEKEIELNMDQNKEKTPQKSDKNTENTLNCNINANLFHNPLKKVVPFSCKKSSFTPEKTNFLKPTKFNQQNGLFSQHVGDSNSTLFKKTSIQNQELDNMTQNLNLLKLTNDKTRMNSPNFSMLYSNPSKVNQFLNRSDAQNQPSTSFSSYRENGNNIPCKSSNTITFTYSVENPSSVKQKLTITMDDPYCALKKFKDCSSKVSSLDELLNNLTQICNSVESEPCKKHDSNNLFLMANSHQEPLFKGSSLENAKKCTEPFSTFGKIHNNTLNNVFGDSNKSNKTDNFFNQVKNKQQEEKKKPNPVKDALLNLPPQNIFMNKSTCSENSYDNTPKKTEAQTTLKQSKLKIQLEKSSLSKVFEHSSNKLKENVQGVINLNDIDKDKFIDSQIEVPKNVKTKETPEKSNLIPVNTCSIIFNASNNTPEKNKSITTETNLSNVNEKLIDSQVEVPINVKTKEKPDENNLIPVNTCSSIFNASNNTPEKNKSITTETNLSNINKEKLPNLQLPKNVKAPDNLIEENAGFSNFKTLTNTQKSDSFTSVNNIKNIEIEKSIDLPLPKNVKAMDKQPDTNIVLNPVEIASFPCIFEDIPDTFEEKSTEPNSLNIDKEKSINFQNKVPNKINEDTTKNEKNLTSPIIDLPDTSESVYGASDILFMPAVDSPERTEKVSTKKKISPIHHSERSIFGSTIDTTLDSDSSSSSPLKLEKSFKIPKPAPFSNAQKTSKGVKVLLPKPNGQNIEPDAPKTPGSGKKKKLKLKSEVIQDDSDDQDSDSSTKRMTRSRSKILQNNFKPKKTINLKKVVKRLLTQEVLNTDVVKDQSTPNGLEDVLDDEVERNSPKRSKPLKQNLKKTRNYKSNETQIENVQEEKNLTSIPLDKLNENEDKDVDAPKNNLKPKKAINLKKIKGAKVKEEKANAFEEILEDKFDRNSPRRTRKQNLKKTRNFKNDETEIEDVEEETNPILIPIDELNENEDSDVDVPKIDLKPKKPINSKKRVKEVLNSDDEDQSIENTVLEEKIKQNSPKQIKLHKQNSKKIKNFKLDKKDFQDEIDLVLIPIDKSDETGDYITLKEKKSFKKSTPKSPKCDKSKLVAKEENIHKKLDLDQSVNFATDFESIVSDAEPCISKPLKKVKKNKKSDELNEINLTKEIEIPEKNTSLDPIQPLESVTKTQQESCKEIEQVPKEKNLVDINDSGLFEDLVDIPVNEIDEPVSKLDVTEDLELIVKDKIEQNTKKEETQIKSESQSINSEPVNLNKIKNQKLENLDFKDQQKPFISDSFESMSKDKTSKPLNVYKKKPKQLHSDLFVIDNKPAQELYGNVNPNSNFSYELPPTDLKDESEALKLAKSKLLKQLESIELIKEEIPDKLITPSDHSSADENDDLIVKPKNIKKKNKLSNIKSEKSLQVQSLFGETEDITEENFNITDQPTCSSDDDFDLISKEKTNGNALKTMKNKQKNLKPAKYLNTQNDILEKNYLKADQSPQKSEKLKNKQKVTKDVVLEQKEIKSLDQSTSSEDDFDLISKNKLQDSKPEKISKKNKLIDSKCNTKLSLSLFGEVEDFQVHENISSDQTTSKAQEKCKKKKVKNLKSKKYLQPINFVKGAEEVKIQEMKNSLDQSTTLDSDPCSKNKDEPIFLKPAGAVKKSKTQNLSKLNKINNCMKSIENVQVSKAVIDDFETILKDIRENYRCYELISPIPDDPFIDPTPTTTSKNEQNDFDVTSDDSTILSENQADDASMDSDLPSDEIIPSIVSDNQQSLITPYEHIAPQNKTITPQTDQPKLATRAPLPQTIPSVFSVLNRNNINNQENEEKMDDSENESLCIDDESEDEKESSFESEVSFISPMKESPIKSIEDESSVEKPNTVPIPQLPSFYGTSDEGISSNVEPIPKFTSFYGISEDTNKIDNTIEHEDIDQKNDPKIKTETHKISSLKRKFEGDDENTKNKMPRVSLEGSIECTKNALLTSLKYLIDKSLKEDVKSCTTKTPKRVTLLYINKKITDYAAEENPYLASDAIAKELQEKSHSHIVKFILEILENDNEIPILCERNNVFLMTPLQTKMLILIANISHYNQQFEDVLLTRIEETVCNFVSDNIKIEIKMSFAHVHTLICKKNGYLSRSRAFLFDVLYTKALKAYPIVHKILVLWPAILPNYKQDEECLLVHTIAQIIIKIPSFWKLTEHVYKKYTMTSLKKVVGFSHGYNQMNYDYDELFNLIIDKIMSKGNCLALLLLSRCQDFKWTVSMLEKKVIPVLNNWENTDEDLLAKLIVITGKICRGFPHLDTVYFIQKVTNIFEKILQGSSSVFICDATVEGLSLLKKHNLTMVAKVLACWKPKSNILTQKCVDNIKSVLNLKQIKFWNYFIDSYSSKE